MKLDDDKGTVKGDVLITDCGELKATGGSEKKAQ
jgi:hypothetical protein